MHTAGVYLFTWRLKFIQPVFARGGIELQNPTRPSAANLSCKLFVLLQLLDSCRCLVSTSDAGTVAALVSGMSNARYTVTCDQMPNWMYVIFDNETGEVVRSDRPPGWLRFRSETAAQKKADTLNKRPANDLLTQNQLLGLVVLTPAPVSIGKLQPVSKPTSSNGCRVRLVGGSLRKKGKGNRNE